MLIFIENTPRRYAWGSRDALPELLGHTPDGEPQAELWLGDHPGAPASVAKASAKPQTLIELIASDPERYGVDGAQLPFLMKVLGIGAPLSLQVHPNKQQAEAGFAREEAAGIPRDARERNYGDPNHKPEVLFALTEVTALCGFRPISEAREEFAALAAAAAEGPGRDALLQAASLCRPGGEGAEGPGGVGVADLVWASPESAERECRRRLFAWALGDGTEAQQAVAAIEQLMREHGVRDSGGTDGGGAASEVWRELEHALSTPRLTSLQALCATHPGDPGVLLSLLLHLVVLQPGEAVYLGARQLHAYLSGVGVEVMAASDNVLRAGLTEKHVDPDELMRVVDWSTLDSPRLQAERPAPGVRVFSPDVPDFCLQSVRLHDADDDTDAGEMSEERDGRVMAVEELGSTGVIDLSGMQSFGERAERAEIQVPYPTVMLVTEGRVRVERVGGEFAEVASVRRGQSLYISAGDSIELSGRGDVFLATVGRNWKRVSNSQ